MFLVIFGCYGILNTSLKKLIICDIANEVQIYALKIKWQKIM